MVDGNAQRSRVIATQSVDAPPEEWLWQSERLFQLKYSVPISTQTGPMTIRGDIPTFHSFTFPIVSQGVVFFTLYVDNAYFYAVDPQTGQLKWKFDWQRSGPLPTFASAVMYFLGEDGILRAGK